MVSGKQKMLDLLKKNVGNLVLSKRLLKYAEVIDMRPIRTLRAEGWDILTKKGGYVLRSLKKKKGVERGGIDAKTRHLILARDGFKCCDCGRGPKDGVKLHVDHHIPVAWGGLTEESNLRTLCEECNLGKKHYISGVPAALGKKIARAKSGKEKLRIYFEANPNKVIPVLILSMISGNREWTREIRFLREEGLPVVYAPSSDRKKQGYVYRI
ncbi:MAG: HNH endonuclease [Candidatus Micrarchaeia archaeon]